MASFLAIPLILTLPQGEWRLSLAKTAPSGGRRKIDFAVPHSDEKCHHIRQSRCSKAFRACMWIVEWEVVKKRLGGRETFRGGGGQCSPAKKKGEPINIRHREA